MIKFTIKFQKEGYGILFESPTYIIIGVETIRKIQYLYLPFLDTQVLSAGRLTIAFITIIPPKRVLICCNILYTGIFCPNIFTEDSSTENIFTK